MPATPQDIQNAIAAVVKKASQDTAFRERALREPVAVLNEAGGLDLPLNTPIRFSDKQEEILVPLPAFGSDPDEITDEEMLAEVSGGVTPVLLIAGGAILCSAIFISIAEATKQK